VSREPELAVTGIGAVTPVGLCAQSSCAALRAGVARLGELETYRVTGDLFDKAPVVGGRVPTEWFDGGPEEREWPGHELFGVPPPVPPEQVVAPDEARLLQLAPPAAREAITQARLGPREAAAAGVFVGLDEHDASGALLAAVARELPGAPAFLEALSDGRCAALTAIGAAARALREERIDAAVVGGVDSWVRGPVVQRLEASGLVRSADNPQGLIPGEAAGFVVLERAADADRRGARILARLLGTGSAEEPTTGTDDPNQAVGLTRALREAHDASGGLQEPPLVVCDLNGDRYRATEWAMAMLRTIGGLHGDLDVWHPADCVGDTGAASGALNTIWALVAFQKRYAPSDRALVWGASEGSRRAAAIFAAVAEE